MGGQRPYALAGERSWLLRRVAQQPDLTLRALLAELAERGIVVSYYAVSALLHPEMATFYREQVTALHSVLGDAEGADRAEAAERLRSLVSKIVLTPEDGRLAIDVHGDLAGILAIAPGKGPNGAAAQAKPNAGNRGPQSLLKHKGRPRGTADVVK
jgi:hypothetical protein